MAITSSMVYARVLFEDCVRRGGCCGRSCGCCVDRNIDKTRQLGAGHCTMECGCCRQSRGFDLTKSEKKKLLKDFHVMDDNSLYRERINRVSIWGLSLDSHDSPFDLIITPPGCERGVQNSEWQQPRTNPLRYSCLVTKKTGKKLWYLKRLCQTKVPDQKVITC